MSMPYGIIDLGTKMCARPKHKYPGHYPAGFLEFARKILVGNNPMDIIWHVPGGMAREYNGRKGGIRLTGFGCNDRTIDMDPACKPDFLCDVRHIWDFFSEHPDVDCVFYRKDGKKRVFERPRAIIIDRDYSEEDAEMHKPGKDFWPRDLAKLVRDCSMLVVPYGLIGVLDYAWPDLSDDEFRQIFRANIDTGKKSRAPRRFSVWQERF